MIEKDYIMRMVNALSKVLGQLIGLDPPKGLEVLEEACRDYLRIDGDWLDALPDENLLEVLQNQKRLNIHQLEFLAELLTKEGELLLELNQSEKAFNKLKKALILFNHAELESGLFSFERRDNIAKIEGFLN